MLGVNSMKFIKRSTGHIKHYASLLVGLSMVSCAFNANQQPSQAMDLKSASELLGNPDYPAISYGGYRGKSREEQPDMAQLKEDIRIMHAMGIRFLRTYNLQFPHAANVVKAIDELKNTNPEFEMYVMLGVWIDCAGAWTAAPDHTQENYEANSGEIDRAVALTVEYPDIIKVIAVGNEAMVHWASPYFVSPAVILNWVNHLQDLKSKGNLPKDLWITSSDNFASWGGGGSEYHNDALIALIRAVDYVSVHTYPFHDTHYNPSFWQAEDNSSDAQSALKSEDQQTFKIDEINRLMERALTYSQQQYLSVLSYVKSLGIDKPIHIGETGWASHSDGFYGAQGSRAADEYKQALYYNKMMRWTQEQGITCFFFEAFNEPWKSPLNPNDSENHFGLFNEQGQAKYAIWPLVNQGVFKGLTRDGKPVASTYSGDAEQLISEMLLPVKTQNKSSLE